MLSDSSIFSSLWHPLYLHEINLLSIHMWQEHVAFVFSAWLICTSVLFLLWSVWLPFVFLSYHKSLDYPIYFQTLLALWNRTTVKSWKWHHRVTWFLWSSSSMPQGFHVLATSSAGSAPCSLTVSFLSVFVHGDGTFVLGGGSFLLLLFLYRYNCVAQARRVNKSFSVSISQKLRHVLPNQA